VTIASTSVHGNFQGLSGTFHNVPALVHLYGSIRTPTVKRLAIVMQTHFIDRSILRCSGSYRRKAHRGPSCWTGSARNQLWHLIKPPMFKLREDARSAMPAWVKRLVRARRQRVEGPILIGPPLEQG
jgi:hypothetical protein